jgi:hypothetical protein
LTKFGSLLANELRSDDRDLMPGEIWPIVRPIGLYNGDSGALGGDDGLYFLSSVDIIPSEPKEARSSSELSIILLIFLGEFSPQDPFLELRSFV